MSCQIEIQNEAEFPLSEARLREAIVTVLDEEQIVEPCALTVVVTDDATVQDYNRQYRGIDAPTDVLSFPAGEPPVLLEDEPRYLGDLIIAYPYTQAQAATGDHAMGDMLALLVMHGTLHLLGHDHDTPENQAAMWAAQSSVLRRLGIAERIVEG